MKWSHLLLVVGPVTVVSLVGCGKSGEAPPASIQAPSSHANASPEAAPTSAAAQYTGPAPDAVVTTFLDSLRTGNEAVASSLLTKKAREEAQKAGQKVQPISDPTMQYQIGQTEYVSEAKDGAHVGSVWTVAGPDGQVANISVIWVLRLESEGWRIAGMATPGEENQPPDFANFEDPEFLKSLNEAPEMAENEAAPATTQPSDALVPATNLVPSTTLQPRGGAVQNAEVGPGNNPLR